ncbi:hypothetical protein VTJ04DRAFT_7794 [Mycothermus thermophilus]|uniref:uncharacterized protein n=1 Tax=Humicola insolens TaxID=85995 RepID=UPI003742E4F4
MKFCMNCQAVYIWLSPRDIGMDGWLWEMALVVLDMRGEQTLGWTQIWDDTAGRGCLNGLITRWVRHWKLASLFVTYLPSHCVLGLGIRGFVEAVLYPT